MFNPSYLVSRSIEKQVMVKSAKDVKITTPKATMKIIIKILSSYFCIILFIFKPNNKYHLDKII